MKSKHAIVLLLIGFSINLLGSILKILHINIGSINGSLLLILGTILEILGVILLIYKLYSYPKLKEFMNW